MYRDATPIDTLELPQGVLFPEDEDRTFPMYRILSQYDRSLSHEADADQSLTMSIPKKDSYSHPDKLGTINGLVPFTSLSEANTKLSEPMNRGSSLPDLSSTSVKEQVAYVSTAHRNSSSRWDPDITDQAIEGSYSKQQNTIRQSSPLLELSKNLGNHIDPSMPSPLPSTFSNSHPSSLGNSSNVTEYDSTNSSDFEEDINGMDHAILQPLTSSILEELLSVFYRQLSLSRNRPNEAASGNTTSRPQSRTATQKQGDSPSKDSITSSRGKRRRKDSDQHQSGDEGDEDRYPHKKLHLDRPVEVQPTFWACPFSKWKPLSYCKCRQYILKDISRVKQHLRRYHERPPYCPVCWEVFREEDGFESHIQDRSCSPRPKPDLEGITTTQQKQLERRSDKQLSKPEQWYAIYTILFPGQPHPDSPYLESDLSSELLLLQKFIATDGLEIVERKAREHIPPDLMPLEDEVLAYSQALFQQAIPEILQRYDASRPINHGPATLKRSGLSSLSGTDCDSGYGTLSQEDRSTQNKGLGVHKEQNCATISGIDHTGIDWTTINDVQIQALLTKSQVTADATQCQDLSNVQISLESGSEQFTHHGSLDLPSDFTSHPCDEYQLFRINESEATFANGSYNWDAAVGAIFDNNGTSAPTDHS
ncbi:hypothetical protein F5Y00DRAFT_268461 [Daldinia vernicosa]|uniref:uncharacterized protein n=1 Tax=Daldinia vernicosa TaxID=114800 RepID=UPI002008C6BE|nr:uncharacterized protein F5Y00DRAFT_268461 [Daldinia vernicosa]KAI0850327.1 hypothetical protein F5Y00DRAFT_268461 [Daldinia vernicosa]